MAYKLQLKRGASGSLPTGSAGEPLFTTDTNDLYIGTGSGNQRYQKYIASGTSAQFLKGDGSLDSTTYTPTSRTLTINGTSYDLSANRTWSVGTVTTAAATTGGQVSFFNGATIITSVSGLYFDGVDKLGVGNSSPAYNLDVTGTFRSTGNLTAASIIKSGGTSSQYLMADGSTSTLTNPVTGTGTTNYLPKWTSGSAIGNSLVHDDGTNVGIGTASAAYKLDVAGEVRANNLFRTTDGTNIGIFGSSVFNTNVIGIGSSNNVPLVFGTNATERARFTSGGNLLVNSSTDNGNRLQVTGNGFFSGSVGIGTSTISVFGVHAVKSNDSVYFRADSGSVNTYYGSANALGVGLLGTFSNHSLSFYTNSTEKMILTSSGNLGLGVTPSAWGSNYKSIDIGSRTSFYSDSDVASIVSLNQYIDAGGRKYKVNGVASFYEQYNGLHAWYNAPSGTAGNAITFTQAMTLTANGRLLLGTTTEGTNLLEVNGTGRFTTKLFINRAAAGNANGLIFQTAGTGNWYVGSAAVGANTDLQFYNDSAASVVFNIANTTGAATFSSSVTAGGQIYVNAGNGNQLYLNNSGQRYTQITFDNNSSSVSKAALWWDNTASYFDMYASASAGLRFYANATESMRITSGGNLLVGTTTDSGEKLQVSGVITSILSSGSVRTSPSDNAGMLHIRPNAGQNGYITFTENAIADRWAIGVTNGDSNFYFRTPYPTSTPVVTIASSGAATFSNKINFTPIATPSSPSAGDVYYDSSTNKLRCYNGTSWNDLF